MFSVISRSVAVLLDQPAPPLMAAELRRYGPAARKGSVLSTVPQSSPAPPDRQAAKPPRIAPPR
jgi:hypothetical protein